MGGKEKYYEVATVPTVYGIETLLRRLKIKHHCRVATVPTVYGIETFSCCFCLRCFFMVVATVPTVYGIETYLIKGRYYEYIAPLQQYLPFTVLKPTAAVATTGMPTPVATVPTVYGIETSGILESGDTTTASLQQYLPFTVLKLPKVLCAWVKQIYMLQQYLPFTVLKPTSNAHPITANTGCNSTYRLRY